MDNKEIFSYRNEEYVLLITEFNLPEIKEEYYPVNYSIKEYQLYRQNQPVIYSGGLILGYHFLKDYGQDKAHLCYSYDKVIELIFQDGILETSVDHSKAMLRVRKNLERGLRSLEKGKDKRCIRKFIYHSFIRDYRQSFFAQTRRMLSLKRRQLKLNKKSLRK